MAGSFFAVVAKCEGPYCICVNMQGGPTVIGNSGFLANNVTPGLIRAYTYSVRQQ
jgi:hypothetical protein